MTAAVATIGPIVVGPGTTAIVSMTVTTMPYMPHAAAVSARFSVLAGSRGGRAAASPPGISPVSAARSA